MIHISPRQSIGFAGGAYLYNTIILWLISALRAGRIKTECAQIVTKVLNLKFFSKTY